MNDQPWRFWAWPRELRRKGILGMNRRNADYILAANPRRNFPNVDNKVRTKQICQSSGIGIPETYAIVARHGDIRRLPELVIQHQEFVVKPAHGSGGRGVEVICGQKDQCFLTNSGARLTQADLRYHVAAKLSVFYIAQDCQP